MDENTAQNNQDNNVKFGFTKVSTPNATTQGNTGVNPSTSSAAPNTYVVQPTPLPNLNEKISDQGNATLSQKLPDAPAPLPPSVLSMNWGRADNGLDDIMPDLKRPKAMSRDPKSNNLAQPIENENSLKENLKSLTDSLSTNTSLSQQPSTTANNSDMYQGQGTNDQKYNIQDLMSLTINRNASDLHIAVGYPPIIRIDGELVEVGDRILNSQDAQDLIYAVLNDEKKELLEVNREVDLAYSYTGAVNARFRINAFYSMKNLCAAFRLIPSRIRTIEELMLPQIYHQFTKLKQGLILVTGPTGHGKSTTLAAMLEDINRTRFAHIVTIEDPIEYVFEGKKSLIDQREMNDDTHSWEIALRSALRQDPDVILVGEMRDYETIAATITLAETGHLVFATLHTNSASQTIDRIIDVFPDNQQQQVRAQLSNILEAVVAQRLIPLEKGGRRAVSEIMIKNSAVGNLIREGKTNQIDNVIRTSSDIGMISLEKSLVNLVREGAISVQKAQEYAVFPEEVLRLLKG